MALNHDAQLGASAGSGVERAWSQSAELAELFLRACSAGAPCADLANALAESVLEAAKVRLALDVLERDEHAYAKATELASRVLDAVGKIRAGKASGGENAYGASPPALAPTGHPSPRYGTSRASRQARARLPAHRG